MHLGKNNHRTSSQRVEWQVGFENRPVATHRNRSYSSKPLLQYLTR